ncbi:MAG: class I SAM-dependent methyltransferase [Bacteroidales bacterium]
MKKTTEMRILFFISLALILFSVDRGYSQNLDVPYVPTPHDVVARMLDVTSVGPGDYVIDLGSGDGRIVIAAAERGAVGHGIDLNPTRISEAVNNARKAGVDDRVIFMEGDLFETDISRASVITMYLLSSVNLKLRPVLLKELRPGTRIVSHSFSMGDWEADKHVRVDNRHIYYWVIPADVSGEWEWSTNGRQFSMNVTQEFQKISLELDSGNRSLAIEDPLLVGERINFSAVNSSNGDSYVFNGRVDGNSINGKVQIRTGNSKSVENWSATLRRR